MSSAVRPRPSLRQSPPTTSRARMSLFNTIRTSIYGTVVLFTVICLAMAGHFQSVLAASNLTRFIPFAIFVCSASLLIVLCLLAFTYFFRERNPITSKFELSFLGMVGFLWLILGVYLVTSDAQSADVECFSPDNLDTPLDDELANFHTDQYHAMYRVLMIFSLMNAVIIISAVMLMLFLACFFRRGDTDKHMWQGPITSYPWFSNYKSSKQSGAKANKSSVLPVTSRYMSETYTEKPERKASSRRDRDHTSTRPYPSRNPYTTPYPTGTTSYPTGTTPYPTGTTPYPTGTTPYPTGTTPYPTGPTPPKPTPPKPTPPKPTPQKPTPQRPTPQRPTPPKATSPAKYTRQGSGSAPRNGSATAANLEHGGMLNPYSNPGRPRGSSRH